jgi:hypothetical protein
LHSEGHSSGTTSDASSARTAKNPVQSQRSCTIVQSESVAHALEVSTRMSTTTHSAARRQITIAADFDAPVTEFNECT